jgi:hypothetical protein
MRHSVLAALLTFSVGQPLILVISKSLSNKMLERESLSSQHTYSLRKRLFGAHRLFGAEHLFWYQNFSRSVDKFRYSFGFAVRKKWWTNFFH